MITKRLVMPKVPVAARATLFGGEKVSGEFFVAASSPHHAGPETLLELLNDTERWFVPFQTQDGMLLLNRSSVRTVEFESPDLIGVFTNLDRSFTYNLRVRLRVETEQISIAGLCYTGDLRPETQRPVDLLNSPAMFILLYNDKLTLCNKNAISHAAVE